MPTMKWETPHYNPRFKQFKFILLSTFMEIITVMYIQIPATYIGYTHVVAT